MSKFPKSASGFLLIFLALGPSGAFADDRTDSLHEGYQIEAGARANRFKDGTIKPEGMIALTGDFALVPIPGGGRLNGTHLELELSSDLTRGGSGVDRAQVALLNWSHLKILNLEHNRDENTLLAVEAVGVRVPFVLAGDYLAAGNYSIGHAGFGIGYQWQEAEQSASALGQKPDFHAGSVELVCRLDHQRAVTDRWALRSYQEASYLALLGQGADGGFEGRDRLRLGGGVSVHYDITEQAPYRLVKRTHPATGEISTIRVEDEGMRLRWKLLDVRGQLDISDDLDRQTAGFVVTSGIGGEF
jgi:hypothetical protein